MWSKNIESKKPRVEKDERIMILSNCAICNSKESRFIKEQKATRLFSSLGIKMPLSQVLLLNPILSSGFKINKIIKEFLLGEDKLMPEMHVKQPGSTYSAWRPIYKKGYKKLTKQKNHDIYKTKKNKACFQCDMAYGDFKDLLEKYIW